MVIRFSVSQPRRPLRAIHIRSLRHRFSVVVATAALVLLTLGAPPPAAASGTVHYMSTTGSDSWAGTGTRPWRTLYASLLKLHPGDTLYIRGGTYEFSGVNYTSLAGTSTHPILIAGYPGETAHFHGTSTPADWLYFTSNASWITLRNLTVDGGGAVYDTHGSSLIGFIGNSNHITLDHMRLYGDATWTPGQHLVYVAESSVNDITVKWSIFDGRGCMCAGLLHFYHEPNALRVLATRNTFRNVDQGIVVWASVSGLRITYNTFSHTRIAVRHHNSLGTIVAYNRGTSVGVGLFADSRVHLTASGNVW